MVDVNVLDLFCGIGGFSLAMQRAGFNINKHYASEIDKYAKQIYRKQFPGSIQLGDVTGIGNEHGKIDIITGGFPCQTFSIAGKRRGFEDTRGTLFFEIERLAREYRPSYMVLENVKGLGNHEGGDTIRIILGKLRRLDYSVQLLLLNTKDFGVPQNRERFAFICTLRGKRQPEISRIRERKTEVVESGVTAISTRNTGLGGDEFFNGYSPCLTAAGHKDMHKVKIGTLRTHKDGNGFREMQSGVCPTIPARAREDGSGQPIICTAVLSPDRVEKRQNGRRFKDNEEPSFTLTAQDKHGIYDGEIIRRLTPIECERLQDYPDAEKSVTIQICLDHQKINVNAEEKSHRLLKSAGNVEKIDIKEIVLYAEESSNIKNQQISKLAQGNVHINLGEESVEIFQNNELLLSVNSAEKKEVFGCLMEIEDFALMNVGMNSTLEKITHYGKGELHLKEQSLIHQENGKNLVKLSGKEIMQLVESAMTDLTTPKKLLKSTISKHLNIKDQELKLKTLFSYVILAITGYIPEITQDQNILTISIKQKHGWTQYGIDETGKEVEISDTQRYKCCGNSITVKPFEEIMKAIKAVY